MISAHEKAAATVAGLLLLLALTAAPAGSAAAQSQPCTNTFFSSLVQLMPCRAAVSTFSPAAQPSEACCSAIKLLGQPCLCLFVTGPPLAGVDRNLALQLPAKCTANFEPCNSGIN